MIRRWLRCFVVVWMFLLLGSVCVASQSATIVNQVIETWRTQSPKGANLDLSLLEQHQIDKTTMVTALTTLLLEQDTQKSIFAVQAIRQLLDGRSVDVVLLEALQSPDATVRVQAVKALAFIQDKDKTVAVVSQIQQQDPSYFIIILPAISTVFNNTHEPLYFAEQLINIALNDSQPSVRQAAANALGAFLNLSKSKDLFLQAFKAAPTAMGEMAVWVTEGLDPVDRNRATTWIQVLIATQSLDVIPALSLLFGSSDLQSAWTAAQAARLLSGSTGVINAMLEALHSPSSSIRLAVMQSLSRMLAGLNSSVEVQIGNIKQAEPVLVAAVIQGLQDEGEEVRWAAVTCLAGLVDRGVDISRSKEAMRTIVSDQRAPEPVRAMGARILAKLDPQMLQEIATGELLSVLHQLNPAYRSGTEGYHTFRIPAIIVSPQGDLLAFAEGRRYSRSDTGDIDLVLKRSKDNGITWSRLQVVWNGNGPHTAGNPVPVVDESTGRIWLFMTHNLGQDTQDEIQKGTSDGVRTIWATYSDDDGYTWAEPTNLFAVTQDPTTRWDATGPGVGIQLRLGEKAGRLIIPAIGRTIYSDDHGVTWRQGQKFGGTSESQIVELTDGRLLRNDRAVARLVPNRRPISYSTDQGFSWGSTRYAPELVESYVQASTIRYEPVDSPSPYRNILLFSNPAHATSRVNMTVKVSLDEGDTWTIAKTIYPGPSAYSCLVRLPDGTIGLLFEGGIDGPYEYIYFTRFTLDWLLDEVQAP
jgi:HEAT repeat protein